MIKIETNWDQVKQDMIDDVSEFVNEFKKRALTDIRGRLAGKGIKKENLKILGNKITYVTDGQQDYENGQVYFDEVDQEINKESWLESI